MAFASEAGRFYLPDGSMLSEVPNKSKGGMRPATVRDALKMGAEPSFTTVSRAAAAPGLVKWQIEQAIDAALTLPRAPEEPLEAFKARVLEDSQEQAKKARERGIELHTAIQRYLKGEVFDLAFEPHINQIKDALRAEGIDLHEGESEKSFCRVGFFGSTIDWRSPIAILDFKGIEDDKLDGKLGYDNHIWQLASYQWGKESGERLINVFVGRETGRVKLREWTKEEAEQGLKEFMALLRFYRLTKGFPV